MRLRVAIGADHGGFELKQELIRRLGQNVDVSDMGARVYDPHDDYPDYVVLVGRSVARGEVDRGILICGSGVGACVAANKIPGVRASVCHDTYSAHQGVEHDDLNVLCLGARVVGVEVATELAVAFLMARFTGEERHLRRLEKVKELEVQRESADRDDRQAVPGEKASHGKEASPEEDEDEDMKAGPGEGEEAEEEDNEREESESGDNEDELDEEEEEEEEEDEDADADEEDEDEDEDEEDEADEDEDKEDDGSKR